MKIIIFCDGKHCANNFSKELIADWKPNQKIAIDYEEIYLPNGWKRYEADFGVDIFCPACVEKRRKNEERLAARRG